jgi:hypothetical protein
MDVHALHACIDKCVCESECVCVCICIDTNIYIYIYIYMLSFACSAHVVDTSPLQEWVEREVDSRMRNSTRRLAHFPAPLESMTFYKRPDTVRFVCVCVCVCVCECVCVCAYTICVCTCV